MPEEETTERSVKRRTITLTDQAPVTIVESDWPLIATGKDWQGEYESKSPRTWAIRVREHADGRAIVYGIYVTLFQGESDIRAGLLLKAGEDLVRAIRIVGESIEAGPACVAAAIADLPAKELV